MWHPKESGCGSLNNYELYQRKGSFLVKVGRIRFTESGIQDPEPSTLESSPLRGDVKANSLGSI